MPNPLGRFQPCGASGCCGGPCPVECVNVTVSGVVAGQWGCCEEKINKTFTLASMSTTSWECCVCSGVGIEWSPCRLNRARLSVVGTDLVFRMSGTGTGVPETYMQWKAGFSGSANPESWNGMVLSPDGGVSNYDATGSTATISCASTSICSWNDTCLYQCPALCEQSDMPDMLLTFSGFTNGAACPQCAWLNGGVVTQRDRVHPCTWYYEMPAGLGCFSSINAAPVTSASWLPAGHLGFMVSFGLGSLQYRIDLGMHPTRTIDPWKISGLVVPLQYWSGSGCGSVPASVTVDAV